MVSTFSPIDGLAATPPPVDHELHLRPILVQGEAVGQELTDPRSLDDDEAVLEVMSECPT